MTEFEKMLIYNCSPTLLGLKASSLFSCSKEKQLYEQLNRYNKILNPFNIYFKILYEYKNRVHILFYHRKKLLNYLQNKKVSEFLEKFGYPKNNGQEKYIENILLFLKQRTKNFNEFPHEIGFFLDYPVDDVIEYINQNGKNFKLCGYWKVYTNEEEAKRKFICYKKCRDFICKKVTTGTSILNIIGVN